MNIKKGDKIVVISGKYKGKKGNVLVAEPAKNRVIVEKINMATKHKKPRNQREPGGIIHQEAPIHASNVMLICPKCSKATRIAFAIQEDGEKSRRCTKCGATYDK